MPCSALAAARSRSPTICGVSAATEGLNGVLTTAVTADRPISSATGPPAATSSAIPDMTANDSSVEMISRMVRSKRSASTPAYTLNNITGRKRAPVDAATQALEWVRS